jgi:hypothetical protein
LESDFAKLSFERAVQLFEEWGFRVEEGPGHGEVTLILEGPSHRTYCVYEITRLPQIAAVALRVRQNIDARKGSAIFLTATSRECQYPEPPRMLN